MSCLSREEEKKKGDSAAILTRSNSFRRIESLVLRAFVLPSSAKDSRVLETIVAFSKTSGGSLANLASSSPVN